MRINQNVKVKGLPSMVVDGIDGPEMLMLYDNGIMAVPVEMLPGNRVAFSPHDAMAFFPRSQAEIERLYPGKWDETAVYRWYFKGIR